MVFSAIPGVFKFWLKLIAGSRPPPLAIFE